MCYHFTFQSILIYNFAIYCRVDIGRSDGKNNAGDVLKITRLYETADQEILEGRKPSLEGVSHKLRFSLA